MKTFFFIFCLFLICFSNSCTNFSYSIKEQKSDTLTFEEIELLKDGDVILRHGFGLISDAIVKYAKDDYPVSHCGILFKNKAENFRVIHTVSNAFSKVDGMQEEDLQTFVTNSKQNSIIIIRHRLSESDSLFATKIKQQAKIFLQQKIPFDHQFNFDDTTEFYCTEMMWHLFKNGVDADIFSVEGQNYHSMHFAPFFDTNSFIPIINHVDSCKKYEN